MTSPTPTLTDANAAPAVTEKQQVPITKEGIISDANPVHNKSTNKMFQVRTSEKRWLGLRGTKLINAITVTATMGFLLFGYDQGVMSGIIAAKQFNDEFPATKQSGPNDVYHGTIQGTTTAIYEVGCLFGAIFGFFFAERLGRRRMMFLGSFVMCIGTIIQVSAFKHSNGFAQFLVGRTITGIGNGANTSTIPSWVAECTKSHNRGFLTCIEASTVAIGTFIAYWIDFGLSYVDTSVSWRFPIALQIIFAIFLCVGVCFLPESPRWLLVHGHTELACQIIADLNHTDLEDVDTLREIRLIIDGIEAAQGSASETTTRDLFTGGKTQHFQRMAIGASSQVFQQLGGCNAVIYYSTVLFENTIGLETELSLILGGVLSTVYALSALTAFMMVETAGRRAMFFWGSVGQMVSMIITFACLIPGTASAGKGAAFGLFLFIAFFGATWLPLPWLYPAELNPLRIRTKANAVSTMNNWLFNFLVVQVLPTMTASIGWGTFLIFAVANGIFIPIVYFYYPETKGRTLETIDIIYAKAYTDHKSAVTIARELPTLSSKDVEHMTAALDIHGNGSAQDPEKGTRQHVERQDEEYDSDAEEREDRDERQAGLAGQAALERAEHKKVKAAKK